MAVKAKETSDFDDSIFTETVTLDSTDNPIELVEEPVVFELTDKDLPKSARGTRGSKYAGMLEQFKAQEKPTKYVQFSGRKPASVYVGLKKAITAEGLDESISVVSRGNELWLVRK